MENKLQKPYLTYYNVLIAQYIWQAYCQNFLISLSKQFIKLNLKIDVMIKNANRVELNTNFFELSCEYANVKDDLKEHKCFQNKKIR